MIDRGTTDMLDRDWFARSSTEVAPELLNKRFTVGPCSGRIVEVEAYAGESDPASHGCRGITPRTEVMFGPAGFLYVYFTYGMHWCANVVTDQDGECGAVLIRAIEPLAGIDEMRTRRTSSARRSLIADRDLCNGPAKLCQAFGVDGAFDGTDLLAAGAQVRIEDDGVDSPGAPGVSGRIGLSVATELPWRWFVADSPHVSKGRTGPRR